MPVRDDPWPAGTPLWVDLGVDDPEAARAFYTALFGWEHVSSSPDSDGSSVARLDGRPVAGIGPRRHDQVPSGWLTVVGADDVSATAAAVVEAGGRLAIPPGETTPAGLSLALDPAGAAFGLRDAAHPVAIGRYNEPGAPCWNELRTRGYDEARRFYAKVFGYEYSDLSDGTFVSAAFRRPGDRAEVGGIVHETDPAEADHWLTWFEAADVDAAARKAADLGGRVLLSPQDSSFGRISVVEGSQGERFGLITLPA